MQFGLFSEWPMATYQEQDSFTIHPDDHPARSPGDTVLLLSNRFFNAGDAKEMFHQRLEQFVYAEEVGFDMLAVNEHHVGPMCMSFRNNIMSATLAARTKHVKILQVGNPLPLFENPAQLAEEIALVDIISEGRVVAGFIRGLGAEQLAGNVNPAFNRARFSEAHDLLIKTWTEPGPFRWEGEQYSVRVVNPWMLPVQKPHPYIVIPGVASHDTIKFAAQHGYPYFVLASTLEITQKIWDLYDATARESGFEPTSAHHGYLMPIMVADTDEEAFELAEQFMWMGGQFHGRGNMAWAQPSGYSTWASRRQTSLGAAAGKSVREMVEDGSIVAGSPDTCLKRIRVWLEQARPGTIICWTNEGRVGHKTAMRGLQLLGEEVLPAVRALGAELGLESPFEANMPISLANPVAPAHQEPTGRVAMLA